MSAYVGSSKNLKDLKDRVLDWPAPKEKGSKGGPQTIFGMKPFMDEIIGRGWPLVQFDSVEM